MEILERKNELLRGDNSSALLGCDTAAKYGNVYLKTFGAWVKRFHQHEGSSGDSGYLRDEFENFFHSSKCCVTTAPGLGLFSVRLLNAMEKNLKRSALCRVEGRRLYLFPVFDHEDFALSHGLV